MLTANGKNAILSELLGTIVFKKQINISAFRKNKKQLTKDRRYDKVSKSSTKRQQNLNSKMFEKNLKSS